MNPLRPRPAEQAEVADPVNWLAIAWILLIWTTVKLAYGSSLEFFFSQDDFVFLLRAARVDSWKALVESFLAADHFYRPVPRTLVFVGLFRLFGLNAGAYHQVSLAWHAGNGILLFFLYRRLFAQRRYLPGMSSLIFAAHHIPFLTVYWVSGIQDLCVTSFLLLSLHLYLKSKHSKGMGWQALSLLSYALALLSKEIAITFPAILLLVELTDRWLRREKLNFIDSVGRVLGHALLLAPYLLVRSVKIPDFLPIEGPYSWSLAPRNVLQNLWAYLHDSLYLHDWVVAQSSGIWVAFIILLAALVISLFSSRRRWTAPALGIGWFAISLLPVLLLSKQRYSFYAYFSLGGMALILAFPIDALLSTIRRQSRHHARAGTILRPSDLGAVLFVTALLSFSIPQIEAKEANDPAGIISKSILAKDAISEVQSLHPELPKDSTLYVTSLTDRDVWAFGHGDLFRLYYPDVKVIIAPEEDLVPVGDDKVYVYRFREDE